MESSDTLRLKQHGSGSCSLNRARIVEREGRMETPIAHDATAARVHDHALRVYAVSLLGPATAAGGLIWAILQPYRVTLLHPRGQGLWWLVFEPPLFVVLVGALFTVFVARPVLSDLEQADAATR
jgi:hypothetical protein